MKFCLIYLPYLNLFAFLSLFLKGRRRQTDFQWVEEKWIFFLCAIWSIISRKLKIALKHLIQKQILHYFFIFQISVFSKKMSEFFSCYEAIKLMDSQTFSIFSNFSEHYRFEDDMKYLIQNSNKKQLNEFVWIIRMMKKTVFFFICFSP